MEANKTVDNLCDQWLEVEIQFYYIFLTKCPQLEFVQHMTLCLLLLSPSSTLGSSAFKIFHPLIYRRVVELLAGLSRTEEGGEVACVCYIVVAGATSPPPHVHIQYNSDLSSYTRVVCGSVMYMWMYTFVVACVSVRAQACLCSALCCFEASF